MSAGYLWAAQLIPLDFWSESEVFNARSMPMIFGGAGIVVSALLILVPSPSFNWRELTSLRYFPAFLLLTALVLYGFAIDAIGFLPSTITLLAIGFFVLGERRLLPILVVALGVALSFFGIMDLLGIYFSPGELWQTDD